MLTCDRYLIPETLDEALGMAAAHGDHRLIAGGTDLIPYARAARAGDLHFPVLVDLGRVAELRGVWRDGDRIHMGACVTFGDLLAHPLLRGHAPLLGRCAAQVGDGQIRREATIGGNIMNASPAADGAVALLALNATVTLERLEDGARASREMPLESFILGPGLTARGPGEILTRVACDATGPEFGTAFRKVGRRRSLVIAVASAAAAVRLNGAGDAFADVRLALGAVAPVPIRLHECEAALAGEAVSDGIVRAAARLAAARVASRSRQDYRREVAVAFLEQAVGDALARIGARSEEVRHV